MTLICSQELDEGQVLFWRELLDHVARSVNHGALCGSQLDPLGSSLRNLCMESQGERQLRFQFGIEGVDAAAWRVILQLMAAASECSFPLDAVHISSPASAGLALVGDHALALPYPGIPDRLPFSLERLEPQSADKDRYLEFEFARSVQRQHGHEIEQALQSWAELLMGGYPKEDEHPMDNACDEPATDWVGGTTLLFSLPGYLGSESAFDAAVCMAIWFHQRIMPLRHMTVH